MPLTAPSLERYRTPHVITPELAPSGWQVCGHCGIRVYTVMGRRWRHDQGELRKLEQTSARTGLGRGVAIFGDPSRPASSRCESGGHPGCTCSACGD